MTLLDVIYLLSAGTDSWRKTLEMHSIISLKLSFNAVALQVEVNQKKYLPL